jgi:predicted aldo/keto reductase-like oxidoreductase
MIYNEYAKTGKMVSLLGFGSTRFKENDLLDDDGLWRCAMLVRYANKKGINYFDLAPEYANGKAHQIYAYAFQDIENNFYISDKSTLLNDKTADSVYRRINDSIKEMNVSKIHFYNMWSIMNMNHYKAIIAKGGPYDGAIRAKEEGLIDHIVCSSHAGVDVNLKMIDDCLFEGITISLNIMTYTSLQSVIVSAMEKKIAIVSMNPLGGGVIVTNSDSFGYLKQNNDENIAASALRFVASIPGVTTVLSGMSSQLEIDCNINSLNDKNTFNDRYLKINDVFYSEKTHICTGCGYCKECPSGIPIPAYMKAYNSVFFPPVEYLGRKINYDNEEKNMCYKIFCHLKQYYSIIPPTSENKCIKCGKCERHCTQKLPIINRLDEIYKLSDKFSYSVNHLLKRTVEFIEQSKTGHVGLYPAGAFSSSFYNLCISLFQESDIILHIFDKDPLKQGKEFSNYIIQPPDEIPTSVDVLIILHYVYQTEIYNELKYLENNGVKVLTLNTNNDIIWLIIA